LLRRDPGELEVCQLLSGGDGLGVLDLDGLLPALLPNCCRMNCHRLNLDELSVGGHDLLCRPRGLRVVTRLKLNLRHHGLTRASLLGRLIHCPNQLVPGQSIKEDVCAVSSEILHHFFIPNAR